MNPDDTSAMDPTDTNEPTGLSKNQLKNEAKKKAKLEKFQAKQAKLATMVETKKEPTNKNKKIMVTPIVNDLQEFTIEMKNQLPMPSSYDPTFVEAGWSQWWEQQGYFKPRMEENGQPSKHGTFVIPIPPPNVTGTLHLGHALTISIQDTLIRYHRMLGKTVLYNPGCDHAGIATQSVVEKRLWKEKKITRYDLGREKFLEKVWEWKTKYGEQIYTQLKRLGGSFDWSRAKFTMDPSLSHAVTHAFIHLFNDGTIYRATRLVNWCSYLTTALSNLEVENKELHGKTYITVPGYKDKIEFGTLVYFAYPLNTDGKKEEIVVATTRLETMLGDVAVAVHPEDARYKAWIGKTVCHPFFPDRVIPIVADTYVDPNFGTGAVKITPAHDFNDFELGKRHQLPCINILHDDGTLNENAGIFQTVPRFTARTQVLLQLKEKGLFRKSEDHAMVLPTCSRSGDIIEPRIKPQWYVRCQAMAQRAMDVVQQGQLEILPKASEKEWFRWLEQIQDWCISRQLWWGHRVPAYFIRFTQTNKIHQDPTDSQHWVAAASLEEAEILAKEKFPTDSFTLHQDEDVLDTWFSSGLWPFSIFGWPTPNPDLTYFYPTSLLETGWDILFFWVARMVMLGLHLTGQSPFKQVFCHAMVRDAHGRKMSKSLGNVIDPIDVLEGITLEVLHQRLEEGNLDPKEIEKAKQGQTSDFPNGIPQCGADALRFALCAYTSTGRDINLDILRVEGYRKFCNKLWQATKFALSHLSDFKVSFLPDAPHAYFENLKKEGLLGVPEQWILAKLNQTIFSVRQALDEMNFMLATSLLHQFWLYDLCDVFLEICKDKAYQQSQSTTLLSTLYICFDHGLKLLHPFMPFVTEELWQRVSASNPSFSFSSSSSSSSNMSIMVAMYPSPVQVWEPTESFMTSIESLLETVKQARSLMMDYNVHQAHFYLHFTQQEIDPMLESFFQKHQFVFLSLLKSNTSSLNFSSPPPGCITVTLSSQLTLGLLVKGYVDIVSELEKMTSRLNKVQASTHSLRVLQAKPQYKEKVRPEIQLADETKLKTLETEMEQLSACMENFLKLVS